MWFRQPDNPPNAFQNVKPLLHAIEAIRAALKDEASPSSVAEAAAIYAQFSADAVRRLDRISAMLQAGSDYQAVQVAEEEPPLLDLTAALSFDKEKNWKVFCEAHGLKVAPSLDTRIIQDLQALYAAGLSDISANHPLYKDFRAAVSSRDDEKARHILKIILKLNPQDENARKELLRLEHKGLQEKIDQLREALKKGDEERIAMLTEGLKAVAPATMLERLDVFHQGADVCQALRRRQAEKGMPEMLATMLKLKAEGQWQQVGQMLEILDTLFREHGLVPANEEQQNVIDELTRYHQQERTAGEKQHSFDRALKSFLSFVREVETRLLTGAGVTYEEIAAKDENFVKRSKELEDYQLPMAAETSQRIRTAGQSLRARLQQMQRHRRVRNLALAAAALVLLCCISIIGLHAWKAWTLKQELASYQKKEDHLAAEELIKKLRRDDELLLRWPFLQAKIAEVNSWIASTRVTGGQAGDALLALESSFEGEHTTLSPALLVRQIDDAEAFVNQLGGDAAPEPRNRLVALKTKAELHLASVRKELVASTAAALSELEQRSINELSYEKLAADVSASLAAIDQKFRPLEALLQPQVLELALPDYLGTRIRALRQHLNNYDEELRSFSRIREETALAGSLISYRNAIARWQTVKFSEAALSLKVLSTLTTEKAFQAALFTGDDEDMLQTILDDQSGRYMAPKTLLEAELKVILSLLHDGHLNNIFESTLVHYSSKKPSTAIWSMGRPEETVIGESFRWNAKFYQPDPTQMAVLFIQQSFTRAGAAGAYQGVAVNSTRLSQTSEIMNQLEVGRISDEKGEAVSKSLFDVYDKLVQDTHDSPIAKAYVMLKLEEILRQRPGEWGLHYCPSLRQDLRNLHQTLGSTALRSEDWLVPASREKFQAPLAAFFNSLKTRTYMTEALAQRNYLYTAVTAGLRFVGYVETDLSMVLNQQGRTAGELWVIGRESGKPVLVTNPAAGTTVTDLLKPIIATASVPLSPVFFVPLDRQALLHQYQKDLSGARLDLKTSFGKSAFPTVP
jgi:hypothetical protein